MTLSNSLKIHVYSVKGLGLKREKLNYQRHDIEQVGIVGIVAFKSWPQSWNCCQSKLKYRRHIQPCIAMYSSCFLELRVQQQL